MINWYNEVSRNLDKIPDCIAYFEKELIEIKGKADTVGKPILYGTTQNFLDYFGINNIEELPTLKDFKKEENEIGPEEPQETEETPPQAPEEGQE